MLVDFSEAAMIRQRLAGEASNMANRSCADIRGRMQDACRYFGARFGVVRQIKLGDDART